MYTNILSEYKTPEITSEIQKESVTAKAVCCCLAREAGTPADRQSQIGLVYSPAEAPHSRYNCIPAPRVPDRKQCIGHTAEPKQDCAGDSMSLSPWKVSGESAGRMRTFGAGGPVDADTRPAPKHR